MTPRSPFIGPTLFRLAVFAWEHRSLTLIGTLLAWAAFEAWS